PTTTPAITISLGAITPTSVNGITLSGSSTPTLAVTGTTTVSGANTGDVTLAGQNYLSISGQVITANAVDLSGTNATGTLAAGRFPALTGDVTTSAGALGTTIASSAVTTGKIANNAVDGTKIALGSDVAGDLMYYNGTDYVRLPIGTGGQFLQTNGGATTPV